MAKIKNIQLKAIKNFMGEDYYGLSANIYLKNKKVGYILDSGDGAPMNIEFDSKDIEDEVLSLVVKYYDEKPKYFITQPANEYVKLDDFIEELLELSAIEKDFKQFVKKGYAYTVVVSSCKREENPFDSKYPYVQDKNIGVLNYDKEIKDKLLENYPETPYHTLYKSLEDFIIE